MRYYAVLDADDRDTARNVFIVEDSGDPIAMVVFDHNQGRFVHNTALIEYVAGERARDCVQIEAADAAALLLAWGATLPGEAEVRALAEEAERS